VLAISTLSASVQTFFVFVFFWNALAAS